jgi:hypothetical protein
MTIAIIDRRTRLGRSDARDRQWNGSNVTLRREFHLVDTKFSRQLGWASPEVSLVPWILNPGSWPKICSRANVS